MTDAELSVNIKRGDREAARELVRRHYASVLRFLVTLCRNHDDADELTQETFLRALKHIGGFRGRSGLRTWLHRIAYHEFTHRRRKQRPESVLTDSAASYPFETTSALAIDLGRALLALSVDARAAFVLCDVEELTMDEAATVLRIPSGTVKSRLRTARKQLMGLLEPEQEVNLSVSRTN
ncbi:MAG TPA: RNA polymerase sigma factor [Fimbriimonadaceae bacterium]|nr:RNA polymerase sigma factor [Fimbriimonadaceae bacterium]